LVYLSDDCFGGCFAAVICVGVVAGGCLAAHSTIALADALPPCCFVVQMLCRSLLQQMLGRCDCDALWSSPADAWPPFFVDYLARRTYWCRLLCRFSSAIRFGG
jgi:hypothetical protein